VKNERRGPAGETRPAAGGTRPTRSVANEPVVGEDEEPF